LQPDITVIANPDDLSAAETAHSVAAGKMSALQRNRSRAGADRQARSSPEFVYRRNGRARARQGAGGRCRDRVRQNAGPLAGVPFAVKNLFDVQGLPTAPDRRSTVTSSRRRATPL